MALKRAAVQAVESIPAPIDRYRSLLGVEAWRTFDGRMAEFASKLRGKVVWNVNSTARGGGVAELLAALIPYDRGAGVDERWLVIEGSTAFFNLTKKIHTLLHGVAVDGSEITNGERRAYEETLARNATALLDLMQPGDLAVLHDPQTAGLVPALTAQGIKVVWRSHVGVDKPNDMVRTAWSFLTPYVESASAFVFSRRAYVWDGPDSSRVRIIAPCIDAFTTKNRDMTDDAVARALDAARISARVPAYAKVVVQVSRWDRLKDPMGVLGAFVEHIAPSSDSWLVLAGPEVNSVDDDPEQPDILAELQDVSDTIDPTVRDRIVIAQLSMRDTEENAAIVNALQRRADVVVQKSLAEGFGLTVAEAMWKARPVVASRVGGIEDQIEDGKSGILIDDPADLRAFGAAVVGLLNDPRRAADLGREARLRVTREYLAPRHLMQQAELLSSLV
jgi:trehalose synthase